MARRVEKVAVNVHANSDLRKQALVIWTSILYLRVGNIELFQELLD